MVDKKLIQWMVIVDGAVPLALLGWDAWHGTLGVNGINYAIHTTGKISLIFLLLSLSITPLRKLTGWAWLYLARRGLGVYSFIYAATHFAIYFIGDRQLSLSSTFTEMALRPYLVFGSIGLALLTPLALTSTNGMIRRLGAKRWQALHRAAYYAAIAGVVHYYMLVKADKRQPLAFAAVLAVLLLYRLVSNSIAPKKPPAKRTAVPVASAVVVLIVMLLVGTGAAHATSVKDYGATGNGSMKETGPFQKALDAAGAVGGGEVTVPAGTYTIGSVLIPSNVTLKLDAGSHIVGSPDLDDYPIIRGRWEGRWTDVHRALLAAIDAHHIAIVGPGSITADPKLGGRSQPRQPCVIELIRCQDVRLEDFHAEQQRMWTIHPTLCDQLSIKGLHIHSVGGNGDGIDLDSCTDAMIDTCDIDTGDDPISLKSGRGREGFVEAKPTQNVTIRNCTLSDANFACIGIGSETSGGIRHVKIESVTCKHAKTFAIYIKSRTDRGAFIEDIAVNNLTVENAEGGFLRLNLTKSGIADPDPVLGDAGIPATKDFRFVDIRLANCGSVLDGVNVPPEKPLRGLQLRHIHGEARTGMRLANVVDAVLDDVEVKIDQPPELATTKVSGTGLEAAVALPTTMPSVK